MPALDNTWRTGPKLSNWKYRNSVKTRARKALLKILNWCGPTFQRPCLMTWSREELLSAIFTYGPEYHKGPQGLFLYFFSSFLCMCKAKGIVDHHVYLFIAQEEWVLQYFFSTYSLCKTDHFNCLQRFLGIDFTVQQHHTLNWNDCEVLEGIAIKSIIVIPKIIYLWLSHFSFWHSIGSQNRSL